MNIIAGPVGAIPSPAPITFAEIDAFNRLTLADLSVWEIGLIRRLDEQFIRIASGAPDPDAKPMTLGQVLKERAAESRAAKARKGQSA